MQVVRRAAESPAAYAGGMLLLHGRSSAGRTGSVDTERSGVAVGAAGVAADAPDPRRRAACSDSRRGATSASDDAAERGRLVERGRLAAALDRELGSACRAEAAARHAGGVIARELLRRRAYERFGFVRLSDYTRERLGVSARSLQSAAHVAARLDALPRIAAAFHRAELSWTQVRLLCRVARPENEEPWLDRARTSTVAALDAMIEAECGRDGAPDPESDLLDGEPTLRLRIMCPGRVRCLWRYALELARRVAGEQVATWQAAEFIAAEGIAGRPQDVSVGDRVLVALMRLTESFRRAAATGSRSTQSSSDRTSGESIAPGEAEPGRAESLSGDAEVGRAEPLAGGGAEVGRAESFAGGDAEVGRAEPLAGGHAEVGRAEPFAGSDAELGAAGSLADQDDADLSFCDAFTLDARLRTAVRAIRRVEPRIGRLLRQLIDHRLYRTLGFRSTESYVRERLGISLRKAWALVTIEKTARRAPAFAEAYGDGTISWVRALTLIPVVEWRTADAWIARANLVTLRRLTDEVNWVLDVRDAGGPDGSFDPPPLDSVLVSPALALRQVASPACIGASGATLPGSARAAAGVEMLNDGAARAATESHGMSPGDAYAAPECHGLSPETRLQIGASSGMPTRSAQSVTRAGWGAEVSDGEIRFTGPVTVVALFRDAIEVFARAGEPRWAAVERLLLRVITDWEAEPGHRDPVFARDGWRCAVPACGSRRSLHDHHLRFRSRGGGNELANRVAICAAHHLRGIHTGVISASGTAPAAIRWQLGVRPGAPPLSTYIGDRLAGCVEAQRPAESVACCDCTTI